MNSYNYSPLRGFPFSSIYPISNKSFSMSLFFSNSSLSDSNFMRSFFRQGTSEESFSMRYSLLSKFFFSSSILDILSIFLVLFSIRWLLPEWDIYRFRTVKYLTWNHFGVFEDMSKFLRNIYSKIKLTNNLFLSGWQNRSNIIVKLLSIYWISYTFHKAVNLHKLTSHPLWTVFFT